VFIEAWDGIGNEKMINKISIYSVTLYPLLLVFFVCSFTSAQRLSTDTTMIFTPSDPILIRTKNYKPFTDAWGLDLMMSNNGFGMGAFFRHEFSDELSWMASFAISDVKDEAEFERYDYYGNSYGRSFIPGKKNRLLLMPLMFSMQYRLFKDDIADNFRPFVTAGLGPAMVYVSPYARPVTYYLDDSTSYVDAEKIDFFTSLKYGKMRYTIGGFIGFGAYFGIEKGTISGISVKYFIVPFPNGIEVMEGGYIKNFGGLYITITFGSMF
jgi:hypothetical protein